MGKVAFVFSGQGAQYPGMGKDLCQEFSAAERIFNAFEALNPGLTGLIFDSSAEDLMKTGNTQMALYTVETAVVSVLRDIGIKADDAAGFSLGELSAMAYAGVFSPEEGFLITRERGRIMQEAVTGTDTAMDAVLKLDDSTVERLSALVPDVYPVNYNAPGQVVVSALSSSLPAFEEKVKEAGGRTMRLRVSGGFHSPFMNEASALFRKTLESYEFGSPTVPVWSNVTGLVYGSEMKDTLAAQMRSPVRWTDTIRNMISGGTDTFIEIGPGTTLTGLIKRIDSSVRTFNAGTVEDIRKLKEAFGC